MCTCPMFNLNYGRDCYAVAGIPVEPLPCFVWPESGAMVLTAEVRRIIDFQAG